MRRSALVDILLGLSAIAFYAMLASFGVPEAIEPSGATWRLPTSVLVSVLPLGIAPALLLCRRRREDRGRPLQRRWLLFIFSVGVAIRVPFLASPPVFSDDVYRYLWDGRVQSAGFDPYGIAPNDPRLDGVEADRAAADRVRDRVNHPEIPTIYPPLLELVFRGVASTKSGLVGWRGLLLLADLLTAFAILRVSMRRGRDPRWVALYLWHPLPVIESAWSAHTEAIAVSFFATGVAAVVTQRRWIAALSIGLGGAAKLLPFGYLPYLARRVGWKWASASIGVAALTAVPFLGVDIERASAGLRTYAEGWYFNDVIFRPLGDLLGLQPENRLLQSTQLWRRVLQGAWVVLCLGVAWRGHNPVRVALVMALGFVLLTPTLHPWYVLWLLPFAAMEGSLAGVVLASTVLFAYEIHLEWWAHAKWTESPWVRPFEWALPALILLWRGILGRRTDEEEGRTTLNSTR
ncbi:MAG: DUF2029 domain-containing protein [Planctomycetes bacterium]|nr:DUF2029 domain-containing protein [Planctomycetota bacterium]